MGYIYSCVHNIPGLVPCIVDTSNRKIICLMVQEILTYFIVLWAFYAAGKSLWKSLSAFKSGSGYVCSGGCAGCSAKNDLINDIKAAGKVKIRNLNV